MILESPAERTESAPALLLRPFIFASLSGAEGTLNRYPKLPDGALKFLC